MRYASTTRRRTGEQNLRRITSLSWRTFAHSQDPNFNRRWWIDYIAGECGRGDELMLVEPDRTSLPPSWHEEAGLHTFEDQKLE
jgi:hypothetical protein